MTDELNADVLGAEWDLGEVLVERAQPTEEVAVYLSEIGSYAKSELIKLRNRQATDNIDEIEKIDGQIAEIDKQIEATKYVVHITAIPSRMREDIASKAMSKLPYKFDWAGRDDAENALERARLESNMLWNAQITQVDNPHGQTKKTWTLEETVKFAEALPLPARNAITEAIEGLTNKAEEYTRASKQIDF